MKWVFWFVFIVLITGDKPGWVTLSALFVSGIFFFLDSQKPDFYLDDQETKIERLRKAADERDALRAELAELKKNGPEERAI